MPYIEIFDQGTDATWQKGAGGPFATLIEYVWQNSLGDAQYIWTTTPNTAVSARLHTGNPTSWPRAHRFDAVRLTALVRTTGVSSTCRFRIKILGQEFDSQDYTVTAGATYAEISWLLPTLPDGNGWSTTRLWYEYTGFEAGIVFIGGDELRCSQLRFHSIDEPYPHWTLVPDAAGTSAQWAPYPATVQPFTTLQRYDGDESYCWSAVGGEVSTFTHDPIGAPDPTVIDRVRVTALVKNMSSTPQTVTTLLRIAGVDYRGGCDTLGTVVPADDVWHIIWTEYITDPSLAWPAGNPAGGPWTQAQINAAEIGFENTSGGNIRVTSLAAEVFLTPPGSTVIDWFPTANGFYTDFAIMAPNVGEAAWEDVDEDPPDDAASYIEADATTAGTPQYCSFVCGGAGVLPAGERVYLVELTARVRLGGAPHATAEIVPVLHWTGAWPQQPLGKPITIEDTGGIWFDVKWNYMANPLTGRWEWATGDYQDVHSYEFGVGVLQGDVLVSRIRARIITCPNYPAAGAADPIDMQMTTGAINMINRSTGDGTLFAVTEFGVGLGGYDITAPGTVVPVVPGDVALISEIWRGPLTHVQYDSTVAPIPVQYWCRLPRGEAIHGIGEVGLWAEILWSPFPWEIGTSFLFAIQHHPLQTRHQDTVGLYVLTVTYP